MEPVQQNPCSSQYGRYDVFLSFRGEDTRKTLTDHLYTALNKAGFVTFRDDDELERGEDIKPGLQQAINRSRASVIVFSKDYASSGWCLDELAMILERRKRTASASAAADQKHVVVPVFFDVDPSNMRKQTGIVAKAFARHQKTQPPKKVETWRKALAEVADLAGMVLQNEAHGYESKLIEKIVNVIGEKLRRTPLSVAPNMIAMDSRVREINLWVKDGSTDVGVLVMYGISGIGKTTIAKLVYNSNFRRFGASSFLENIKEKSEQPNGLVQIQKQLLYDILNGRKVKIHSVSDGIAKLEYAVSFKKVLLVLDDVDHMDQLDAILRMKDQFYPGSKIIITTRLARLRKSHQVTKEHEVGTLNSDESLELFSWHAFGQAHPIEGYEECSRKVVHHSGGLPLALQVLGSSLQGESIGVWKSALEKLEVIPNGEIMNKLRISYDSLQDDHDRNLFLHIACFFIEKKKDYICRILDGCDFFTIVGIQNLIDRCLVSMDKDSKLKMHDMVRDMGRGIVQLESKEPCKRSRLWHHKDSLQVLKEKKGGRTIEGLVFNVPMHVAESRINSHVIVLETSAFARMPKLKLLHLTNVQGIDGCYEEFTTELRWLCWREFPLECIPTEFSLENLIVLEMQYNKLGQICRRNKSLPSLKILDLSHSRRLTGATDFSFCPNLEKLILEDCASLIDVHESIEDLERLVYLSMKDCKNLRMLPKNMFKLKSLETFIISGCSNIYDFPVEVFKNMESLKVLETDGIPVSGLWPGKSSSSLMLSSLPCSLVTVSLSGCNLSDDAFPTDFSHLSSLRRLNLDDNPVCSLPKCIRDLARLDVLSFDQCEGLKSLLDLPKVDKLSVLDCKSLEKVTYQSFSRIGLDVSIRGNDNLVEWEYLFKLVPIGNVEEEMFNVLGLCNMQSMASIRMYSDVKSHHKRVQLNQMQGLYECGIFSTCFGGNEVPGHFSHKSKTGTISFTVPLFPSDKKIRGFNMFVVYVNSDNDFERFDDLLICAIVRNKSKGLKRIHIPCCYGIPDEGEEMTWLSHWNVENNQFHGGDEVIVEVRLSKSIKFVNVKEIGIEFVIQQQEAINQMVTTQPNINVIQGHLRFMPLDWPVFSDLTYRLAWVEDEYIADNEEEQQGICPTIPVTSGNNNGGLRGWKLLVAVAGFFFSLSLIARSSLSRRKNRPSTSPL